MHVQGEEPVMLRTGLMATLIGAALAALPALAQEPQVIRWGNTAVASLPHGLSKIAELDPELQAKYGLRIEITDFRGNSANCIAALLADEVDLCQVGITTGLSAIAEGADFKSFATMGGQVGEIVLGTEVAKKAGVDLAAPVAERISRLKGLHLVGSGPGTPNYLLLDHMLRIGGLSIDDVDFQVLVDIVAMNAGVANGAIDGTYWSVGGMGPSQLDGTGVAVLSLAKGDIPELKDVPLTAIYTSTAWLEANRDTARRAKEMLKEVVARLRADPAYATAYKQAVMPDLDPRIWENVLTQNISAYFDDLNGTEAGWNFWIEPMKSENKPYLDRAAYANAFVNLD